MKIFNHFKYPLIIICIIAVSCTNNSTKEPENKVISRADSLFMFKNITSSLFKADSATMSQYVYMDTIQKMQYLTSKIIDSENPDVMKVGQPYINEYIRACFISKQDKIGDMQPIIVSASGDDYDALILLLLDKNNRPISHLLLSGGLNGGPDSAPEDSITLIHERESIINNDEITTYILRFQLSEKSGNRAIVDSVSCIRKILPNGTIKVIKTDSIRYTREYSEPKHSW